MPPLAGFAGKVFLLLAAIDEGLARPAVFAAADTALALDNCVAVVAEMNFRDPERHERLEACAVKAGHRALVRGTLALGAAPSSARGLAQIGSKLLPWNREP